MEKFRKIFTRRSIIWTWIISYVIILVIPVICNAAVYLVSISALKKNTVKNESAILDASVLSVDDMLRSLSATAGIIEKSSNTNKLMNEGASFDDPQIFADASNFISSHVANSENISAMYVYYPMLNKCIGTDKIANTGDFFGGFYNPQSISYNEWLNKLNTFSDGDYIAVHNADSSDYIDFFYSIPSYPSEGASKATVVVRVDSDTLLDIIEKRLPLSFKNFYIVNDRNEIIAKSERIEGVSVGENSGDIKGMISSFKGFYEVSCKSSVNDWEFISLAPNSAATMQEESMRRLMFLNIIFLIIASVIVICFVASKNYAPMAAIKTFMDNNFDSESKNTNEYERITKLLSNYSQSSRIMEKKQISSRKSYLLLQLIEGDGETEKILAELSNKCDIHFKSDTFAVIAFNVMNQEHLFSDDGMPVDYMHRKEYVELIMSNIFEEVIAQYGHSAALFAHQGKYVAIVALDPSHADNFKDEIKAAIQKVGECVYNNFQLLVTAGCSDFHTGASMLPEAYFEAISCQNFEDDIAFYAEDSSEDVPDGISKTMLMYLSNFIKAGSASSAKRIAETLCDEFHESKCSKNHKVFLYTLCSLIFDTVYQESDRQNLGEYMQLYNYINKLNNLGTNQTQCKQFLSEIIDIACSLINKNGENDSDEHQAVEQKPRNSMEFIKDVKNYIKESFSDSTLSVTSVGIHFGMSSYYLSSLFKKVDGTSLPDYISKVRVEKAKELMLGTDKSFSEISSEVGFGSIRTFTRAFQKLEDVLPSQFRKINK